MARLITIQNKKVLEILKKNKEYRLTFLDSKYIAKNRLEAYKNMSFHYNWTSFPIFLSEVGRYSEMYGANTKDAILLELEIPEEYIKRQKYYFWSDYIYFLEFKDEFKDVYNIPFKTFEQKILFNKTFKKKDIIQVSTDILKEEWLVKTHELTEDFCNKYIGTGGRNILKI
jgi:hypothetical protein